jgi:hypothetical protein
MDVSCLLSIGYKNMVSKMSENKVRPLRLILSGYLEVAHLVNLLPPLSPSGRIRLFYDLEMEAPMAESSHKAGISILTDTILVVIRGAIMPKWWNLVDTPS